MVLEWARLTSPTETVVVYMGVKEAPNICARLIEAGRSAETPAAIIQNATRPDQKTVTGTLASLPALIEMHTVKPPALIIIGDVVKLHAKLNWHGESK